MFLLEARKRIDIGQVGGALKAVPSLLLYVNVNWIHGLLHLSDSWVNETLEKRRPRQPVKLSPICKLDDNEFSPM